jgi:hypothetical protein
MINVVYLAMHFPRLISDVMLKGELLWLCSLCIRIYVMVAGVK